MFDILSRSWWTFALRGLLAIIFGILALIWPGVTLITLIILFGAYALVDGIFAVFTGLTSRGRDDRWWVLLLEGIAGIIFGLLTFFWPNITALVLLYFIAAWAVVTGLLEIIAAIQYRNEISGEGWLILGGIASILFGVILFFFPGAGALGLIWLIGVYAIAFGIFLIVFAFRVRSLAMEAGERGAAHF